MADRARLEHDRRVRAHRGRRIPRKRQTVSGRQTDRPCWALRIGTSSWVFIVYRTWQRHRPERPRPRAPACGARIAPCRLGHLHALLPRADGRARRGGARSPSSIRRTSSAARFSPSRIAVFAAINTASIWNAARSASRCAISPAAVACRRSDPIRSRQPRCCRTSFLTGPGRPSKSARLAAQKQPPGKSGASA